MRTGSFTSQFRPQTATNWSLAVPGTGSSPGSPVGATAGTPPVALFLHGTGSDHRMIFEELRAANVLSQHVARGGTPFAIAAVDGGESWWHRRATGTDTQAMVVEEFIPLLADQGATTTATGAPSSRRSSLSWAGTWPDACSRRHRSVRFFARAGKIVRC
jgi:hypothetical protein